MSMRKRVSLTISAKPDGVWAGSQSLISQGRTIWIVDAHRDDGRRFIVRADENVSAFVELERQVLTVTFALQPPGHQSVPPRGRWLHSIG
jgi:hypothetical protein